MTSWFKLTLDTQASVEAAINHGNATTEKERVTLELTGDADLAEMKVWGDINVLDPGAEHIAETEEGAEWQPFAETLLLNLSGNPGRKELHVKVRDDVENEATAAASIVLGEEVVPPPPAPRPSNGPPAKVPRKREPPEPRRLRSTTTLKITSQSGSDASFTSSSEVAVPNQTFSSRLGSRRLTSRLQVTTVVRGNGAVGHRSPVAVAGVRHDAAVTAAIGPQMQATLEALGLI